MRTILLFIAVCLYSCANIGTLGGGPADEKPPILLKTNIPDTHFKGKSIVLEFDEYVSLNSPEKNIYLMPSHSKMKFSITRKKVIIQLDTALHENTTYSLVINKGIQDVNASNPFVWRTVFSTGSKKDTLSVKISVKTYKDYKNLKLCLSQSDGRDSFKNFVPEYIYEVNNETFEFSGLNNTKRNLWLFTDADMNNKPDLYKPAALIKNIKTDSAYFLEPVKWMPPFKIYKAVSDLRLIKLYHTFISYHRAELLFYTWASKTGIIYTNTDSTLIKYSKIDIGVKTDTVNKIDGHKEAYNIVLNSLRGIQTRDKYLLSIDIPQYYQNSVYKPGSGQQYLSFKTKPDSIVLTDIRNELNDTFYLKDIKTEEIEKLSFLQLKITDSLNRIFDIIIYKEEKEIKFFAGVNSFDEYLEPGVYKIKIFPKNSLYIFNPFTMEENPSPIYEKTLYLKASWEEILEVKP